MACLAKEEDHSGLRQLLVSINEVEGQLPLAVQGKAAVVLPLRQGRRVCSRALACMGKAGGPLELDMGWLAGVQAQAQIPA